MPHKLGDVSRVANTSGKEVQNLAKQQVV